MISVELVRHLQHPERNRPRRYQWRRDPCNNAPPHAMPKFAAEPSDMVVFNESDDYAVPGDVSTHRNIEEMCSGMKVWMVEGDGIGFALNGLTDNEI